MAQTVMPQPGMMLVLQPHQYKFGTEPIIIQVIDVVATVRFDALPWWLLDAWSANGTPDDHSDWAERSIYVDFAAVVPRPTSARRDAPGESNHAAQ